MPAVAVLPPPVGTLAAQSGQTWPYPAVPNSPPPGGMWAGVVSGVNNTVQQYAPPSPYTSGVNSTVQNWMPNPNINPWGGVGTNPYGPPVPAPAPAQPRPVAAPAPYGTAGQNLFNAQNAQLAAAYGVTGSERQGLAANMATLAAQGSVLGAEGALRSSTAAYVAEQQRAKDLRQQEETQLIGAQNNVGDQEAVAEEDLRRRSRDRTLSSNLGVEAPAQVQVPLGQEGTRTPVGTEVANETQATRVGRRNTQDDAMSQLSVQQAQLDEARAQGTVSEAQAAEKQAELNQSYAELSTRAAQITQTEAGIGVSAAKLPPVAGEVFDETTGTFTTPGQASINQANSVRVEWDPVNGQFVNRAGAAQTPGANGLYPQTGGIFTNAQTGVPTDGRTGNQFINGRWVDPVSGNYRDPQTGNWVDPATGNHYVVMNQQTGAGFWVNPQGMYMSSDGIWRDPRTGIAVYNGTQYSTRRSTTSTYAPIS